MGEGGGAMSRPDTRESAYYVACMPVAPGSLRGVHQYVLLVGEDCRPPNVPTEEWRPHVLVCGKAERFDLDVVWSWGPRLPAPTNRRALVFEGEG